MAVINCSQAQPTDPAAPMYLLQQQLHSRKRDKIDEGQAQAQDIEQKSCQKACLNC